jgi:modification methylase
MTRVADGSVHFIVTSPPYFAARDYANAAQIGFGQKLQDYLEAVQRVFRECLRVLQPARRFCLNVSDLPTRGRHGVEWIPLGPLLLEQARAVGFELADRIIWMKTPMKGFQYGSLPFPPSPLICDSMEYVYVLRKPGKPDYRHVSARRKEKSKLTPEEYRELTRQVWTLPRVRLKDNPDGHVAPFPIELPLRCIRLYSFVGETVLDPFGGSGTTSAAALQAGRNSVLYEINADFLPLIRTKLASKLEALGPAEVQVEPRHLDAAHNRR